MARRSGGLPRLREDLSRLRGALQAPLRRFSAQNDPYWDDFINRPPNDIRNMIPEIIGKAPEGNVFPTQAELHSPDVTAKHVKELSTYLGAKLVGIADLGKQKAEIARGYPYAIVSGVRAEYDPYTSPGVGGQAAVQAGQFVTFIVASWIREMGFRASMKIDVPREEREHLAVAAGLGKLDGDGRLTAPRYGTKVHIADIIFTDLPMQADG
ncbi:MAG TPA: hypothetical protein VFH48_25015 [Chloroflexota bacterium]|nr:hypothetical protein [Chloroflexota bacterium]